MVVESTSLSISVHTFTFSSRLSGTHSFKHHSRQPGGYKKMSSIIAVQ
jgi:hypothetical protein